MTSSPPIDLKTSIQVFLDLIWQPGDIREIRIPKHNKFGHTASGYFEEMKTLSA